MRGYLDLLERILATGVEKSDRTGTGTIGVSSAMIQHDLAKGFPLLTTKRVHPKSVFVELEFFIRGFTDNNWLKERKVTIWNEWAAENGDLGPIYGFQWRHSGAPYPGPIGIHRDGSDIGGVDQLAVAIETLKKNPSSRRIMVSAWNPEQLDQMALQPCHVSYQFIVQGDRLDLNWYQRSVDSMLGLPFNLASYACLVHLVAKEVGLREGVITGFLGDTHIYKNHLEGAREQLTRDPDKYPLPRIETEPFTRVFDWEWSHSKIVGYEHYPAIKLEVAV
ncbi:thymidylate synthase [Candidatus Uhrbacteria bacterium]|nr:thymidylate synthase [Candidatus Uhrbacteria bacterium]